jgi:hypothetical protein
VFPKAASKGAWSLLSGSLGKGVVVVALLGGASAGVMAVRARLSPVAVAPRLVAPAPTAAPDRTLELVAPPNAASPNAAPPNAASPNAAPPGTAGEPLGVAVEAPVSAPAAPKARTNGAHAGPRSVAAPSRAEGETDAPAAEPTPESRTASRLREESAAVLAIRKTLLSGDPREALRMLDRAAADFPNGALVQEREALAIRALVDSGQKDTARRRGEAFLRAYPRSPHAAEVRATVGG